MELRGGWYLPLGYGPLEAELQAARTAVAVGEQIGMGVLDLIGEALPELAAHLGAGEAPPGAATSISLPGGEAARWLRLTRTHARLLTSREAARDPRISLVSPFPCLHSRDISSGLTTLAVTGPRGPDLLARLVRLDTDPRVFSDHAVALTGAAGLPLQILRWDRGPLLAYELTVGRDVAEYFWEAFTHAGQNLDLKLIGTEALSRLSAS
jgi:glycine cleavage system aminomethyltransferase T